jgi:hypothetical protein
MDYRDARMPYSQSWSGGGASNSPHLECWIHSNPIMETCRDIRVDLNSSGCGNPWGHVVIFEVENLTKKNPGRTGTQGLILCSRFGLKRFLATPCISTKSSIFHLSTRVDRYLNSLKLIRSVVKKDVDTL